MLYPFAHRSRRLIILPVFSSLFRYRRKDDGDVKMNPVKPCLWKKCNDRPHGLASRFPRTHTFQLIERLSAEEEQRSSFKLAAPQTRRYCALSLLRPPRPSCTTPPLHRQTVPVVCRPVRGASAGSLPAHMRPMPRKQATRASR